MQCEGETRHALYRFYDSRENLLYVGISGDPWRRWREHVATQPWYPQVAHWAGTWYASEELAAAAEIRAIRSERPRFNVAGAVRMPEARLTFRFSSVIKALAAWVTVAAVLDMTLMMLTAFLAPGRPAPFYLLVLGWSAIAANATLPLPIAAMLVVLGTPLIYRLACWLDRNFGPLAIQREREKDLELAGITAGVTDRSPR